MKLDLQDEGSLSCVDMCQKRCNVILNEWKGESSDKNTEVFPITNANIFAFGYILYDKDGRIIELTSRIV